MYSIRVALLSIVFYATIVAEKQYPPWYGDIYQPSQPDPKPMFGPKPVDWYPGPVENERCCENGQCGGYFETCSDCNTCVRKYDFQEIVKCKMRPTGRCLKAGPKPLFGPKDQLRDEPDEPLDYFASRRVANGESKYKCCYKYRCRGFLEECSKCNTCIKKYNFKEKLKCNLRPVGPCLEDFGGGILPLPPPDACSPDSKLRCMDNRDCYRSMEPEKCFQGRCMPDRCIGGSVPPYDMK